MSQDRTSIGQLETPTGRIANLYPPSHVLWDRLCDIRERPPSVHPRDDCIDVMEAVVVDCTDLTTMVQGGGPLWWPAFVDTILESWPRDHVWLRWRAFVCVCVQTYAKDMRELEDACDPAKTEERCEEDGAQDAREWLSRPPLDKVPDPVATLANGTCNNPPAVQIPSNAIRCSQAKLVKFLGQTARGGTVENLQRQGVLDWQARVNRRLWVVIHNPVQHAEFKAIMEKRGRM